jgi:histone H3/H4
VAQELFLQALAELTHQEARAEKRKTVQYDDLGA